MACPVQFIRSITSTLFMYITYTCVSLDYYRRHGTQLIRMSLRIAKLIVHPARSYLHTSRNARVPLKNDGNYRFIFLAKSWRQNHAKFSKSYNACHHETFEDTSIFPPFYSNKIFIPNDPSIFKKMERNLHVIQLTIFERRLSFNVPR